MVRFRHHLKLLIRTFPFLYDKTGVPFAACHLKKLSNVHCCLFHYGFLASTDEIGKISYLINNMIETEERSLKC